ncbi:YrhK-like protein [Microbulbifer donghaiensis]|uniref:YrhK-like protein n=1 Tax=Microbulbifer donghaiensis TaxID=494016 RepID=A0A1M5FPA5_9GAMM|nr:YrhK family protein [Microbulbifer donghaiensis]SHF93387.1 YrhK-like protein [Microbulbifer donghaiensis]
MIKRIVHMVLMIFASVFFLVGSILFLPNFADHSVTGVWCFATGSFILLITSVTDLIEEIFFKT